MNCANINNDEIKRNIELGVVNLHFTHRCNNSCQFCHSKFRNTIDNEELSFDNWKELISLLRPFCTRINFAGGEPLIHKELLGKLLEHNSEIGLISTIITNGDYLDNFWLEAFGKHIAAIGISCDSCDERIQYLLGRGRGNHVKNTIKKFDMIHRYNSNGGNIRMKLNTVVTKLNYLENMKDFIIRTRVQRWKCFQLLKIIEENSEEYEDLKITELEFQKFIVINSEISDLGVKTVFENKDELIDTYIMVNPEGKFFSNRDNTYRTSEPILHVGVEKALKQIGFNQNNLDNIDRMFI